MKRQLNRFVLSLICLSAIAALSSCAHHHNDQDKVENSQEMHTVSISSSEVAVNDKLDVLREVCKTRKQISRREDRDVTTCEHVKVGSARVLRVNDDKTSAVVLEGGLPFEKVFKYEKAKTQ